MCTDDHRGRHVGLLEHPAPLRDSLTVTGENNRFGRILWNVHRDLPSTLVREHLGDKLSGDCTGGLACLPLHGLALIYRTLRARAVSGRQRLSPNDALLGASSPPVARGRPETARDSAWESPSTEVT